MLRGGKEYHSPLSIVLQNEILRHPATRCTLSYRLGFNDDLDGRNCCKYLRGYRAADL